MSDTMKRTEEPTFSEGLRGTAAFTMSCWDAPDAEIVAKQLKLAADKIERLTAELSACRQERDGLQNAKTELNRLCQYHEQIYKELQAAYAGMVEILQELVNSNDSKIPQPHSDDADCFMCPACKYEQPGYGNCYGLPAWTPVENSKEHEDWCPLPKAKQALASTPQSVTHLPLLKAAKETE